jgi:hypothetical protein
MRPGLPILEAECYITLYVTIFRPVNFADAIEMLGQVLLKPSLSSSKWTTI